MVVSYVGSGPYAASWRTIDHDNLANKGNTHAEIDTALSTLTNYEKTANKDVSLGYAGLDTNTKLKVTAFPIFGNTISYYVDCN